MANPENSGELPNLKIEIENDLDEAMETDDIDITLEDKNSKDDGPEEGELSDSKDEVDIKPSVYKTAAVTSNEQTWEREKRYENKGGAFVTGVDIFAKEEQSKLDERAKRFGLDPSDVKPITEQQIKDLYKSMGVKVEEGTEKHFRLNALHVRGTEDLSTQDIFTYFKDYGPASIEWINDYSCNVVWLDDLSAARAMIGLSKHIKGLEEFHAKANPFLEKEEKEKGSDKENEKEEIVVVEEIEEPDGEDIIMVVESKTIDVGKCSDEPGDENDMDVDNDVVQAADIPIPIPPGKWRKGAPHPKAKCILLRFSTRTDKKKPQAEKMSEYYKKYGNPNYGGIKGIITQSRKRKYLRQEHPPKHFEDDQGDERDFPEAEKDGKNPWGNLAKSWSKIDRNHSSRKSDNHRERPRTPVDSVPAVRVPTPDEERNRSVLLRVGTVEPTTAETESDDSSASSESEEGPDWTKRSKIPRMRMYADEEEVRIEKRKAQVQAQTKRRPVHHRERTSRSLDRERRRRRSRSNHREGTRSRHRSREGSRRERRSSHERETLSRGSDDLRSRLDKEGRRRHKETLVVQSTVWDRLKEVQQKNSAANLEKYKVSVWSSESDSEDMKADDLDNYVDLRESLKHGKKNVSSSFDSIDLRSKLNLKKTMRQGVPMQKSPLRIEIDNDEYYKLIGSDQE